MSTRNKKLILLQFLKQFCTKILATDLFISKFIQTFAICQREKNLIKFNIQSRIYNILQTVTKLESVCKYFQLERFSERWPF